MLAVFAVRFAVGYQENDAMPATFSLLMFALSDNNSGRTLFYTLFSHSLHQKCFDREDLLDDYQQQMAEATSASKSADHHDHPLSPEEEHEAPVNLLYIEHLTNIIVNRLASG